jgi:Kef-type K+ transport system membrane component KefB
MEPIIHDFALVLTLGVLIAVSLLMKTVLNTIRIPALVGWLALGVALGALCRNTDVLGSGELHVITFLGKIGVIVLLFRIGLESKIGSLLQQLGKASFIWAGNVVVSGLAGYAVARWILDLSGTVSLVLAIALTATSVGVSVQFWEQARKLKKQTGQLLLDVAEMDDISSIVLMGLLFSLLPVLQQGSFQDLLPAFSFTAASFAIRMAVFSALCILFARYLERPLTTWITQHEPGPEPILTIAALGFIIAATAALLGFSLALGAFFAGLAFSRDPRHVKLEASFAPLYELFSPFFFISIGLEANFGHGTTTVVLASGLLVAAILGKILGTVVPARLRTDPKAAIVLGVSMIPRAEISMIVSERALNGGVISEQLFSAMVLVTVATCILAPLLGHILLIRWGDQIP